MGKKKKDKTDEFKKVIMSLKKKTMGEHSELAWLERLAKDSKVDDIVKKDIINGMISINR